MRKPARPADARSHALAMRAYNPDANYRPGALEARAERAANLIAAVEARRKAARAPHMIEAWAEAEADVKRMLAAII